MPIVVYCQHCSKKNRAADSHAGKIGRCSGCGQTMRIPMASQDDPEPVQAAKPSRKKVPAATSAKPAPVAAKPPPETAEKPSKPMRSGSALAAHARAPKSKRKKPSLAAMLAIGGAAIVLSIAAYYVVLRPGKKPVQIVDLSDEPVAVSPPRRPSTPEVPPPTPVSAPTPTPVPPPPIQPQAKSQPELPPETKTEPLPTPVPPADPVPAPVTENVKPPDENVKTTEPPEVPINVANDTPGLLFNPPAGTTLSVRLDFFRPNDNKIPDPNYFAIGAERDRRFPWTEILLVDARPGANNASNCKIQIRAKVRGLKALIDKSDPRADRFPVRVYRTFMNDLDDGEEVYANALAKLYGSAPKDSAGKVKEPDGRRIVLKRIKEITGEDAVFISDVIDLGSDKDLNPMNSALPPPPSFAASDGDAYYTQWHAAAGDEEPDAWAFGQAMKTLGFVNAGVAHPNSKRFAPVSRGGDPYQFSISAKELLNIRSPDAWEDMTDASAIEQTRKLPSLSNTGAIRERLKNLGGAKVTGRPVTNGAFVVSTGVQKLVVTAMGANKPGETAWRFPGVVHVTDGYMDQCLIRAPAQVYLYSGHGWDVSDNGKSYALINLYPKDNLAAFNDTAFCLYVASYLPGNRWGDVSALEENKIILSEKWKKNELRMQWLFLVGCDVLQSNGDPFKKWRSNCGTFGALAMRQLGLKGVLGFSEHGFTSASLMKRYVERAASVGISAEWMKVFRDDEAHRYTWYETNETYGRSKVYSYKDLEKKSPAYLIRRENLGDKLVPETLLAPTGKDTLEFNELKDGASKATGVISE